MKASNFEAFFGKPVVVQLSLPLALAAPAIDEAKQLIRLQGSDGKDYCQPTPMMDLMPPQKEGEAPRKVPVAMSMLMGAMSACGEEMVCVTMSMESGAKLRVNVRCDLIIAVSFIEPPSRLAI